MFAWTLNLFRAIGYRFYSSADGSVVITFALTLIPLVDGVTGRAAAVELAERSRPSE